MTITSYLSATPVIGRNVYLPDSAQLIGDVVIGDDCSIWPNAVLRGDVSHIRVGRGSNIQDLACCHVVHKQPSRPDGLPLIIGEYVTVGHSAILHGCTIGNEVLIGMGSIVLDGAVIGDHVLLGAGSLVPVGKVLEAGKLYMGRPAKAVRDLTAEEIVTLRYSADHYIKVKNNYLNPPR
jgi:carbonic anhydrase/acetyltransferase-like protein (isoleucine patch superfamily)